MKVASQTSKMFNGKKYKLTEQYDTRSQAEEYANTLRAHGYLARIVETNKAHKYHVYRRVGLHVTVKYQR